MIVTYAVVGLLCAAVLGGCVAARPTTPRGEQQTAARRRRFVARHPLHATVGDIEQALAAEELDEDQVRLVVERAAVLDVNAYTMWLWIDQFDARTLAVVLAADLPRRDVLDHLTTGVLPDLEELRLFAAANGLDLTAPRTSPRGRTVLVDSGVLASEPALPPIHEPGSWSGLATPPRLGEEGGLAA